jgi:glucose/arabinose dehydrogenase
MRLSLACVAALLACSDSSGPADGELPLALEPVATGLEFPIGLAVPPGDPRLFVVEKGGRIRIIENGPLGPTFLDLRGRVSTGGEQGCWAWRSIPATRRTAGSS